MWRNLEIHVRVINKVKQALSHEMSYAQLNILKSVKPRGVKQQISMTKIVFKRCFVEQAVCWLQSRQAQNRWIGLGISSDRKMPNSDAIVAYIDSHKQAIVSDR